MRNVILIVLLTFVSSSAFAEWVQTGGNDDMGMTTYSNPSTIRKKGNKAKMWVINDYETARKVGGDEYMSMKLQYEFDCKEELWRVLAFTVFNKNMGNGVTLHSESNPTDWSSNTPGSVGEKFWKIACGKNKAQ